MPRSLKQRMVELKNQLDLLPETDEPPPTTLQVLGRSNQEQDWQRLFFHFLTPQNSHGLDHALLEHLLQALSDRDDLDYSFSRFDLDDIQIELEVRTSQGRPDAVLWSSEEWFICWELKVEAAEGEDQTQRYVDIDSFGGIDLDKLDVPRESHHYIFLAPGEASPPEADEFVHVSWEWVASQLQTFLAESQGEYPARTTAQLHDFIGTIRNKLTMTEYQENQQEKVKLYIDHYDVIAEVQAAFEDQWGQFVQNWGTRLAQTIELAEIVTDPAVPEEFVALDMELENGDQRRWVFRQGQSDWSWMIARGWWTNLEEGTPIYTVSKPNARVGYLHRLEHHRPNALRENELIFQFRNAPSSHDSFYDNFAKRFNTDDEIPDLLPSVTTRPGVKSNVLKARYNINTEVHDDFFEAYIATLARAIDDHVVSNPALVHRIDSIYEQTIREDVSV